MLTDVNFELEEGTVGVIVGPSGSGKTTLLNVLSGVLSPDAGEVYVDGTLVERAGEVSTPPSDRNVGYIFQDYLLFPHMTVFENVAYGLKARHLPEQRVNAEVQGMLDALGIRELGGMKPGQISGGQMQRVALGRALVLNPGVLLMDEPLSALDWQTRETLRAELRRIFGQFKTTVIYVTHDLDEAFYFGNRIGVLGSGKLARLGTREDILGTMNSSTARFFGFNLMRARLLRTEGPLGVFSAPEWRGLVHVTLVGSRRPTPDEDVLLAFAPSAVRLGSSGGAAENMRAEVLDVRQFRDTVQVVVGEPPRTVVAEVPAHEFDSRPLKRGDGVTLSIAAAWAVVDA